MSSVLTGASKVLVILGLFVVASAMEPARAQGGVQALIEQVDTEGFPVIEVDLDVRTPEGDFVEGLESGNLFILEDGMRQPIAGIERLRRGIQFVLAVNPGPSFAIRDAQGKSRYEYLLEAWLAWAESRAGHTGDDVSFLPVSGGGEHHLKDLSRWAALVRSYQPAERGSATWLDVLSEAIDLAADPSESIMRRVVLFVTAPLESPESPGIENLIARAGQAGVRIYIWMVASTELFNSPQAALLSEIAGSTGGMLFSFSGTEPVPELENYFGALRNIYHLSYTSKISAGGSHQISVEIELDGSRFSSPVKQFEIEVLPPAVMFVSPPTRIIRTLPSEEERRAEKLIPQAQTLKVMIEFPDGHPRKVEKTVLYVDGSQADMRTAPPYDEFTWDLSQIVVSGEHLLAAEAVDEIGLTGKSADIPVIVTIEIPPQSFISIVSKNRAVFAILAVIVAGAILLLVLVLGGRLQPEAFRRKSRRKIRTDPVTQPVVVKETASSMVKTGWRERLSWPHRKPTTPEPYALLIPLTEGGEEDSLPPLPLRRDNILFGRDASHVDFVLDDPSVDPVHALLQRNKEGEIRIMDKGSVAGTWVNYTPVSREGVCLEHGDLVHLGKLGFRFVLRQPVQVRKPVARFLKPNL